ncbi:MAG TPA: hypothetical protein VFX70_05610 [Mycobacteriales bacterium]|nr:hypothetical protein [Mycobacteriales bacterium]
MEGEGSAEFWPVNELEQVLARCVLAGGRAALLRALARSTVCVLADSAADIAAGSVAAPAGPAGPAEAATAGVTTGTDPLPVPCMVDREGRRALLYTSYRQLAGAHRGTSDRDLSWYEAPAATLFERWPADVDVWLNAGGQGECLLGGDDIQIVAEIAAGREVDEAYEVGPTDRFTDFPGPALPDRVDCAVAVALLDTPEVLEVFRMFRRLDEPQGRTWRMLLILTDGRAPTATLARSAARAVNTASDECCEVHVADVHDDGVYDAVAPLVRIGIPLWRREGFRVPDTPEGIERLDVGPDESSGY